MCKTSSMFLSQIIGFSLSKSNLLDHPLVYTWVCEHIYCMMSDQQKGEGVFNRIDLFGHTTLNACLSVREGEGIPDSVLSSMKKEILSRPRNYRTIF